jgi:hypothetical protein
VNFAETEISLQKGLDLLFYYCMKWKLTINVEKAKVIVFRKGGTNRRNMNFTYNDHTVDIITFFLIKVLHLPQVVLLGQRTRH